MRFTFVSLALFALAHSVVPVHGVPSDSLVVRQGGILDGLVTAIQGLIQDLTGTLPSNQQLQQIEQTIQGILQGVKSLVPRADSTSLASATTGPSGSFVSHAPSSTPQASSTPAPRMRRLPASAHIAMLD